MSAKKRKEFMEKYLLDNDVSSNTNPVDSLKTFIEIVTVTKNKKKSKDVMINLSKLSSIALQSLFIQCLHGTAPEIVRDKAFFYLLVVISSEVVNNEWTTHDKVDEPNNFCKLLCSLVNVELHLIFEEIYSLYTDAEIVLSTNVSLSRKIRLHHIFFIMLDLCDYILILLVNPNDSNSNSSTWEKISINVLLDIKQYFHTLVGQMCDFIKDSCDHCFDHKDNSELIFYVYRCLYTLNKWVSEDEDLFEPYINIIDSIIKISSINNFNISDINDSDIIAAANKLIIDPILFISNDSITTSNYLNLSNLLSDYMDNLQICPIYGDIVLSIAPTVLLIYEKSSSSNDKLMYLFNFLFVLIKATYILTDALLKSNCNDIILIEIDVDILENTLNILIDLIYIFVSYHSNDLKGLAVSNIQDAIKSVLSFDSNIYFKTMEKIVSLFKSIQPNNMNEYLRNVIESSKKFIQLNYDIGLLDVD